MQKPRDRQCVRETEMERGERGGVGARERAGERECEIEGLTAVKHGKQQPSA